MNSATSPPDTESLTRRRSWSRLLVGDIANRGLLDALWSDPDAQVDRSTMLKDGDRCTLVELATDNRQFVLKRFNHRGFIHRLLHILLRSRARWCWVNAQRAGAAGLRTPRPVVMLEERFGPLRCRSFFVSEKIDGRILADVVADTATTTTQLETLADAFASIWNALGAVRLGHRDMKATNFIVDRDDQLWLIDLDAMRWYPPGSLFGRRRRKDLARFMKNWRDHPEAAVVFRARIDTPGTPASAPSPETGVFSEASSATADQNTP